MKRTPFRKILIANRGEIALRIMRTARRLGYGVVAVYSDADRDALHVRAADEAICIGGSLPAQSYLRIEAIIAAAGASGADAVHPGYGFLAENEDFAGACRDAGLVFIGPSPQAIKAMGNKAGAKAIMQAAGVPCVPGYQGEDQSGRNVTPPHRAQPTNCFVGQRQSQFQRMPNNVDHSPHRRTPRVVAPCAGTCASFGEHFPKQRGTKSRHYPPTLCLDWIDCVSR